MRSPCCMSSKKHFPTGDNHPGKAMLSIYKNKVFFSIFEKQRKKIIFVYPGSQNLTFDGDEKNFTY